MKGPTDEPLVEPEGSYARVHDLSVEMYGPDVHHPKYPALAIHAELRHTETGESRTVNLWICDSYDALADLGRLITRKVEERRDR